MRHFFVGPEIVHPFPVSEFTLMSLFQSDHADPYATGNPANYVTPIGTQNVFSAISRDDFKDGFYEALDTAVEERRVRPIQAWRIKRRMDRDAVANKVYGQYVQEVPVAVWGAEGGFDFQGFLTWLLDNLPRIIEAIMSIMILF